MSTMMSTKSKQGCIFRDISERTPIPTVLTKNSVQVVKPGGCERIASSFLDKQRDGLKFIVPNVFFNVHHLFEVFCPKG